MHNCEDGAVESAVINAAATTADKKRQDIAPYTHCVGVEDGCCLLRRTEIKKKIMWDPIDDVAKNSKISSKSCPDQ